MTTSTTRFYHFAAQESLYSFPYHYLTGISSHGDFFINRALNWGLEYLTYMTWVQNQVKALKPQKLLDIGCGDGRLLNLLADDVSMRTGVDLSDRALAFAKAFNPDVRFFHKIVDVPDQIDVITCVETMEHIPDAELPYFVESIAGKLNSGVGKLILSVPTVVVPLNRKHYRHYNLNILESQLMPRFSIEKYTFLFRRGHMTNLLNRILVNRFFVLGHSGLKRFIWGIHKKFSYTANAEDGAHLAVLCRLRY